MNRNVSILLIISLLALSFAGCSDSELSSNGTVKSNQPAVATVKPSDTVPSPAKKTPEESTPVSLPTVKPISEAAKLMARSEFGRATLINSVLPGNQTEVKFPTGLGDGWLSGLINQGVNLALNGLFTLIKLLSNGPLKKAMAKNPTQLVLEFQDWDTTKTDAPTDPFNVNMWIVNTPKSYDNDKAEINPLSATGPNQESIASMKNMITYEKDGKVFFKPQDSSVLDLKFYIDDYPVTIPIHNAEISGQIEADANGGVVLKNGHLKGSLIDTNFRKFIYSLSSGCPEACIEQGLTDDEVRDSCNSLDIGRGFQCGIQITRDAFKNISKGLNFGTFSCIGFMAFCNAPGMVAVDALQEAADGGIGGELKFTLDLALEGRPIVITGVAPTKVIPPVE